MKKIKVGMNDDEVGEWDGCVDCWLFTTMEMEWDDGMWRMNKSMEVEKGVCYANDASYHFGVCAWGL